MELRTAYCLNALFQRRGATRLLNTFYSRIDILGAKGGDRIIVSTPEEAARRLSDFLEPNHPVFRQDALGCDRQNGKAPVEFVIEGLIHDPVSRADCLVEALSMKFFDLKQPSALAMDEQFLRGLVHCDSMPKPHGPSIGCFTATLRRAGESWADIDFLYNIALQQVAYA
jgi:hypothetical protein